ncbi:RimK/LysX family protein [Ancylomarina sp. 16SWW S1-10-2]|uniref:ATP-dependent zinc protease family protein n=1 Tax=Ancylomarina sp. 16SWW S1-10-2 TaxID=2499681 RepID=UPI0012AE38DB|nr:RimK/LysX family protein [Ancylomarina sp. 16SWW S1-10-2]MRT93940.1 peptidase [Ancylomarina sp. 16SWW S1-10-2]
MKIIGRIDKVDFPELDLHDIDIKVDTGAYTSSIHSHEIKEVDLDGMKHLEFRLLDSSHPKYNNKVFKVKNYKTKLVKSSFGAVEQRYIFKTTILIFETEYSIKLSLSERSDMKYPVLLGRRFLNKRFIVDTSLKNLSFKIEKNKK